jgi:hypothetical protein
MASFKRGLEIAPIERAGQAGAALRASPPANCVL